MLTNKTYLLLQVTLLTLLGTFIIFPSHADTATEGGLKEIGTPELDGSDHDDAVSGMEQTLEYNFSPVDRARLRKALADYSRQYDPEHIQIEKQRKAMKVRNERHKAAEAKLEAQRIKEAEAEIIEKSKRPKKSQQAASESRNPS